MSSFTSHFRSWLLQPVLLKLSQLHEDLMTTQAELATALGGISDSLDATSIELAKATQEIVTAVANAGATTPEVDAAVARLQALSTNLANAAKTLDDLNPDAPGNLAGGPGEEGG